MPAACRAALSIVPGTKKPIEDLKRELGAHAEQMGYQWGNGEIGPRGQLRLVEAFRERMPGIADSIIQVAGPAILTGLGEQASAGTIDDNGLAFLVHVLKSPQSIKTKAADATVQGELEKIRNELAIISREWGLVVDTDGQFIDITGHPRLPTAVEVSGEEVTTLYDEIRVARLTLASPATEQVTNAKFMAMAPRRIEWLLQVIDDLKKGRGE